LIHTPFSNFQIHKIAVLRQQSCLVPTHYNLVE
jgi:hypothetical protein